MKGGPTCTSTSIIVENMKGKRERCFGAVFMVICKVSAYFRRKGLRVD